MGIRNAIIITILLSQSLCQVRGRSLASSLLQGLLSSNPQLLKMASNKLMQQANVAQYRSCGYDQIPVTPTLSNGQYLTPVYQNQQVAQYSPSNVIQTPYPTKDYQVYQNVPLQPVVAQEYKYQSAPQPVVAKDVQVQYPASYSTVQQTETTYAAPSKPCPFQSPVPMVNPFLPAASPISALCPPTSSLLPPANPALARSHFLRKIPIPPPCM